MLTEFCLYRRSSRDVGEQELQERSHFKNSERTNCLSAPYSSFGRAKQSTEGKDTKAYIKFITDLMCGFTMS